MLGEFGPPGCALSSGADLAPVKADKAFGAERVFWRFGKTLYVEKDYILRVVAW